MTPQLQQTIYIILGIAYISYVAHMVRKASMKMISSVNYRLATFIDTKLTFIGVIHHELSHALLAFVTGAKIIKVKLFRLRSNNGVLGEVVYSPRGPAFIRYIQHSLSGMAPVACGMITLTLVYNYLVIGNTIRDAYMWIGVLLILQIGYHMTLSKSDIKSALTGLPLLFIVIYILSSEIILNTRKMVDFYIFITAMLMLNLVGAYLVKIIVGRK